MNEDNIEIDASTIKDEVPDSKISKFPEYKAEYDVNYDIFEKIIITHLTSLEFESADFFPYVKYRIKDLLVSVTDDLIRYARYHDIGTLKREKTGENIYSISENVRASFFAKWILKLRPSILDFVAETGPYKSSREGTPEVAKQNRDDEFMHITFCNEILALISLSVILNVKYSDCDKIVEYQQLFSTLDLPTVFYSLRYRVCHQDSYTLLFANIATKCQEEEFNLTAQ